tara:strand:- start:112 stop:432 length:321 start_codon:yes stop_codon:yes gene_type:complete
MSLRRTLTTSSEIHLPQGVGYVRIARQLIDSTKPKRFYEVPYHEQYESRDNESKNWNGKWLHEQYSSLQGAVLDEERRKNMELFILRLKSTKVRANKKIANESDDQ